MSSDNEANRSSEISMQDRQIIMEILRKIQIIEQTHLNFSDSHTEFLRNDIYQNAILVNIFLIGYLLHDLSCSIGDKKETYALRCKITHHDGKINFETFWNISKTAIPELKIDLEKIYQGFSNSAV